MTSSLRMICSPNEHDFSELNETNYTTYAMEVYDNPQCTSEDEFLEDLKRVKYLKRLVNRFESTGEMRERLVLNHLIVFLNVFGIYHGTRLLFFRMDEDQHPILKTFLMYLSSMPEMIPGVGDDGEDLYSDSIPIHFKAAKILREI